VKDENTLNIQEFDNAIKTIMQKDDNQLKMELKQYYKDCDELIKQADKYPISNIYSEFKINVPTEDKVIDEYYQIFKHIIKDYPNDKGIVEDIIDLFYKINENEHNIQKNKKKKQFGFYKFFVKEKEDTFEKKLKLLNMTPDYKRQLINLLGKIAIVKNTHNLSPDLISLMDYLNTNITNKFNVNRNVYTFINDLNIKFLSDTKYAKEKNAIENYYVEFYNLALVISKLKGRVIDNPVWNSVITDMRNGTLKKDEFNNRIWKQIQNCYEFEDEEEKENKTKKNKNKNKTNPKKCDPDIITIGLDIISDENSNNEQDKAKLKNKIPMIEVYLQIDLIEGKIDNSNMDKIKCAYDDEFLGSMFYDLINVSNKINTFPSQQVFFSAKKILEDLDNKNKITKKNGGFIKQKRTTKKSQTK